MAVFLSWFFVRQPGNIIRIGKNFLDWGWQFFSIGYFLPRLLAPWHRDISGYGRGFDLERWIKTFSWNLISRVIGAVMRVFVLLVGILVEVFLFFAFIAIFICWFLIPFLIPAFLVIGILTVFI